MLQRWIHWSLSVCFAFAAIALLSGCEGRKCDIIDKTEEQCLQELPDKGIVCQGALERVEYVVSPSSRHANGMTNLLLRFQDGSSCLLNENIKPDSLNGVPAGTSIKVVWQRIPMDKYYCFPEERWYKECAYDHGLEIAERVEKSQP